MDPRRRRESFDSVAPLYDEYRRGHPEDVVRALIDAAGIVPGSRVLEIGCGTGQVSIPLAREGAELLAVELGPHLAAVARRNLTPWPNARVEVAGFEEWRLAAEPFDAVVCANAFHWLDPQVRLEKAARALRSGGMLVILHPHHVDGGTPGFIRESQRHYIRCGLSDDPDWAPPTAEDAPMMYPEIEARPDLTSVSRQRLGRAMTFTTEQYAGLLQTDSLVLGLDEEARRGFVEDIGRLIATRYGGTIERTFLYELISARKE